MKLLHLTCDFMVYKDYKIGLEFIFPVCRINIRIQHLTSSLFNHRVTIHHDFFLKSLLCEFPHRIFHQLLILYLLINDLLLSKFIQTGHTGRGVSELKIISLYLAMVSLMASSSTFFVFIQFRRGIFNFFASSNSDVLFILVFAILIFVTSVRLQKSFGLLFTPQKIHHHHHHHHSACCIVGFLHRCIYALRHMPEDDNFTLFVERINL